MSDTALPAADAHGAEHHDDDPWSHVPPPSFWPFITGVALVVMFGGTAALLWQLNGDNQNPSGSNLFIGQAAALFGTLFMLFGLMGWCHQVIKEKAIAHDLGQQQTDLKMFTKMFLIGEFAAFGAVFGYFYVRTLVDPAFAAPEGLHLGGALVAFATFLLLSSSVTCEFAHHALLHNQIGKARALLLGTILLGVIFLGFQGYEYGLLYENNFTLESGAYASVFYIATGFHGLHVLTGLVMLFLAWMRLEMGAYSKERHFSMIAASWYWHFVDVVWILLFITVYVV